MFQGYGVHPHCHRYGLLGGAHFGFGALGCPPWRGFYSSVPPYYRPHGYGSFYIGGRAGNALETLFGASLAINGILGLLGRNHS